MLVNKEVWFVILMTFGADFHTASKPHINIQGGTSMKLRVVLTSVIACICILSIGWTATTHAKAENYSKNKKVKYEHLVLFKLNENTTPEKKSELLQILNSLKKEIPGIKELTAGLNVTEETASIQGYQLGLRVTFDSKKALQNYQDHPAHVKFKEKVKDLVTGENGNVLVMDYPIQ